VGGFRDGAVLERVVGGVGGSSWSVGSGGERRGSSSIGVIRGSSGGGREFEDEGDRSRLRARVLEGGESVLNG